MKRRTPVVVMVLVSALLLGLVACGGDGNSTESNRPETESQSDSEENGDTNQPTESDSEGNKDTETETGSETEPETDTDGTFTYTKMDQMMVTTANLNVRTLPNTEGIALGQLPVGTEVHVTGQCVETGWYRIDYNGGNGFVSNEYVEAPKKQEPNPTVDANRDVAGGKEIFTVGSGLFVIGNAAFETYKYNEGRGATYAELITAAADAMKDFCDVYCMPIPLGSGLLVPDEYYGKVSIGDQGGAISAVLGQMGANVKGVNIYPTLYEHRSEYLYFRTDHHWTQLGAYYAYTQFCKEKGMQAHDLDFYKHVAYDGFVGSFYFNYSESYAGKVGILNNNPDTVYTYYPVSNATMTVTDKDGQTFKWPIIKDVSNYKKGVKYSCFIAGDNPYTIIENKDITDGSSCIVVKESYGNAFVPLLVDHYQTIHVIDQRYWDGNLITFAKENGVTDVIFANNLTAIGSKAQLANFNKIINN